MGLFKKKPTAQVIDDSCKGHLDAMRKFYHAHPAVGKSLPKPLWIRLHKNDPLNVVYRDKDIIFDKGQVYYAYIIQANEMLFQKGNNLDLPATVLYSTHPFAEEYPGFLMEIGREIAKWKGCPEEEVPEQLREPVRIITDELDRSNLDFTVDLPDPEDPEKMVTDVDVHFCSLIVFHKDIPDKVLQSPFIPVLAAPELSPAVIVLPGEYWTSKIYDF